MFIQGDLQAVFDALYITGVIDPVLKMDWSDLTTEMSSQSGKVDEAIRAVNDCGGNRFLLTEKFNGMDFRLLQFLAMEVAREFAEFADRKDLH